MTVRSWNVSESVLHRSLDRRRRERRGAPDAPGQVSGQLVADLTGFEEVPPRLTEGRGAFRARIAPDGASIEYELSVANLTSPATEAHIHFGQPGVNGEIFVFLCGGEEAPSCPGMRGTVRGTITAEDILAVPSQGLMAQDLQGALRIIRAGLAYVNVHTSRFPAGEIRGQVRVVRS